jgi:N-acylneuraminate cytidylyltransferase
MRFLASEAGRPAVDALAVIPTTAPLRQPEDIEACIQELLRTDADVVLSLRPAVRNPYYNMVVLENGYARYAIDRGQVIRRRQDAPAVYDITTVAYVLRPAFLLRARAIFDGKVRGVLVPSERALDIDSAWDLHLAELILADAARSRS